MDKINSFTIGVSQELTKDQFVALVLAVQDCGGC